MRRLCLAAHRLSRAAPAEDRARHAAGPAAVPRRAGGATDAGGDAARRAVGLPAQGPLRVRQHAGGRRPRLIMGHYARGSRRVVAVEECPVHAGAGNARAFALPRRLRERRACRPPAPSRTRGAGGVLKSLAVRVARRTAERMMTVVVTGDADRALRAATRRALAQPAPDTALHVNLHPRADAFVFGRDTRRISGSERLRDEVGRRLVPDLADGVLPDQRRRRGAAGRARARRCCPSGSRCSISTPAPGSSRCRWRSAGHDVVAVEENAGRGGRRRGQPRPQPHSAGAVPLGRRDGRSRRWRGSPPARRSCSTRRGRAARRPCAHGCSPGGGRRLAGLRVVQSRDAGARPGRRGRHGYAVESLQPVDMFPHTPHVETVAVLRRPGRHS